MSNTPKGTKSIALVALSNVTATLLDKQKELELKRQIFEKSQRQVINEIDTLKEELKINTYLYKFGWFYVGVYSTDCDLVQSYYVRKFQSLKRYRKFIDKVYECAEGPTTISIISKSDYNMEKQHPTKSRDRIMEAYENGNGRSVIV